MTNSLVITAPGTLSAPSALAPRRLHSFPQVSPTKRWVASQLQLLAGANVASWGDQVAGLALNPGAANTQPLLELVNNVYGVKTDGVNDLLGTASGTMTDSVFTLILVARMVTVASVKPLLNVRGNVIRTDGSSKFSLVGATAVTPSSAPVADTGLHFLAAVVNGASSIMRVDAYTATGDVGTPASPTTFMANSTGSNVSFAEIAYFNSALTDVQLQAIRTALKRIYPTLP